MTKTVPSIEDNRNTMKSIDECTYLGVCLRLDNGCRCALYGKISPSTLRHRYMLDENAVKFMEALQFRVDSDENEVPPRLSLGTCRRCTTSVRVVHYVHRS